MKMEVRKLASDFLLVFLCLSFVLTVYSGNKYSESINLNDASFKKEKPFRMNKVNLVWEKAKKRIKDQTQLEELFKDLKAQDRLELETKKRMAENSDEDGEFEAVTRSKLLEITEKYGLDDAWIDKSNKVGLKREDSRRSKEHKTALKMDKKLDKLWKKAQAAGFSDDELNELQKEFIHHRQKLEEFNQLKNEIDSVQDMTENSLENKKTIRERQMLKKELNDKHRNMKTNFMYLNSKIEDGKTGAAFSEPKVIELWLLAKKANFSEVELQSLKEELKHFENKVKKHMFYQDQLNTIEESQRASKHKDNYQIPEKHANIRKKTDELARKVKKYHTELKTRISSAVHTEL